MYLKALWVKRSTADARTLTWDEAMDRFGSDKPDLRFGMELVNMSEATKDSDFPKCSMLS